MVSKKQEIRLVLRAQCGDGEALDELFQAVQEPLYRYLAGLLNDAVAAEDVLQDVFLLIYRKLGWLRQPELFRPWIFRIASREAFRWLRRERRWADAVRDDSVLETGSTPEPEEMASPEMIEQLARLVGQVSPASRVVLVLHYLHEMSLQEVADILGLTLGTVKSRLAYGLAVLRKALGDQGGRT